MPICDFGIYNPEFHYHPFPHHLHEESTLPQQLFPLLKYFQNWLSGNDFDCPKNSPTLLCTVQVWRNVRSDCTDIGMDIGTDIGMDIELSADGKENKWSLSFEPWSPVIESTHPGLYDAESIKAMFPAVKADKP